MKHLKIPDDSTFCANDAWNLTQFSEAMCSVYNTIYSVATAGKFEAWVPFSEYISQELTYNGFCVGRRDLEQINICVSWERV